MVNKKPSTTTNGTTRLIIARHGNTFDKGDIVTRVGARTDLPLSESGKQQAQKLGLVLQTEFPEIGRIFVSSLQRTQQTAEFISEAYPKKMPITANTIFDEVDYGPDENQPEALVVQRIGPAALEAWETKAVVPEGWIVDPKKIRQTWRQFLQTVVQEYHGQTTLVVTSNGIARFALNAIQEDLLCHQRKNLKLATGSYAVLIENEEKWTCHQWNIKP